ncbi:MAG TPA: carboxypeptidase-like regulatory domain-containing protein, partial [Catalimonadaceae bacterium]|nr:carboxypeptidase-like regulatory domain-containing protein [Catalimonadaceae bacterium]
MFSKFKTGKETILGLFFSCLLTVSFSFGQSLKTVRGVVLEESSKGQFSPLLGASVFWSGTTDGVSTDSTGSFSIPFPTDSVNGRRLVVRYLGYESDTL